MSNKINILCIVKAHFNTLKNTGCKNMSKVDCFTFIIFPVLLSIVSACNNFNLNKDLDSLLVNFGAIFTALLLSVIVLIYDQENRTLEKVRGNSDVVGAVTNNKLLLLKELYHNISFAILCSLVLVVLTFIHSTLEPITPKKIEESIVIVNFNLWKLHLNFNFVFTWATKVVTPLIILVGVNIILTIVMIVKRLYLILINNSN
ncbi:TPA: hypothetical protein ACQ6JW_003526 [Klebsiella pneumoniae]|uniref:hypothetical protein n=1 Tax=Klebsiella TaxID=570 RepID=UPI000808C6BC|nr:hypothetical protein [Klebsiella pneumoniae]HDS9188736.1 hypothetical protein [Klebsiella quasipneumoniae subsp. similipneumoniae]MBC4910622.1 hypothetical protein [Klebsiella pneumoniae]MBC4937450.1 hypothetical protein [Klebsiella pneumoniae]WEN06978.1 hypothetical protein P0M34_15480 [Klebsiella pneumoniae]SBX54884.1 Uncharacterised protein [Klebsiella pneumoniae]